LCPATECFHTFGTALIILYTCVVFLLNPDLQPAHTFDSTLKIKMGFLVLAAMNIITPERLE
jgi:hypothetical protein